VKYFVLCEHINSTHTAYTPKQQTKVRSRNNKSYMTHTTQPLLAAPPAVGCRAVRSSHSRQTA